jgi:hypothetical protein
MHALTTAQTEPPESSRHASHRSLIPEMQYSDALTNGARLDIIAEEQELVSLRVCHHQVIAWSCLEACLAHHRSQFIIIASGQELISWKVCHRRTIGGS